MLVDTVTASGTSVSQQEQPVTTSEVSATQGPPSVRPRTGPYTPAPPLPVPSDDYDTAYEYPDGANSVALGLGVGPGEHEAPPALGPVSNRTGKSGDKLINYYCAHPERWMFNDNIFYSLTAGQL